MNIRTRSILNWLDNNILLILSGFLLAFIPLYPKLPLFEAIPGYIVRVRIEDLLVVLTALVWMVQVAREKVSWKTPLTPFIAAYAIVGLLSSISAVLITQTVPPEPLHIGKTLLHYFRYLEYFALFFFLSAAVKSRQDLKKLLAVVVITLVAVVVYGMGQKYLYWPVYSTMNREFSKGVRLYLTEHARVQSTFGGHYDLAGYLVIIIPIMLALALSVKRRLYKIIFSAAYILGLWLLIVSASRTSFLAFLASAVVVVLLKSMQFKKLGQKLWYFISRGAAVFLVTLIMLSLYGDDMYERLLQALEGYPTAYNTYTAAAQTASNAVNTFVLQPFGITQEFVDRLTSGGFGEKPENGMSLEDAEVLVSTDERPTTERPSDVYKDIPDKKKVTRINEDGTTTTEEIEVPRTYSENALKYGLSVAIRLDYLWPKAIEGFMKNPVLGSGYATLTKETVYHFTEAESTDNNFLRTLGETGLLGFSIFYGAIIFSMVWAYRLYKKQQSSTLITALSIGYIAASIGLLINATYIDVYAASKIAFVFWGLTGIMLALVQLEFGKRAIPFYEAMTRIEKKLQKVRLNAAKK